MRATGKQTRQQTTAQPTRAAIATVSGESPEKRDESDGESDATADDGYADESSESNGASRNSLAPGRSPFVSFGY